MLLNYQPITHILINVKMAWKILVCQTTIDKSSCQRWHFTNLVSTFVADDFGYLRNPIWWAGMITSMCQLSPQWLRDMTSRYWRFIQWLLVKVNPPLFRYTSILHMLIHCFSVANFAAYTFAPAILVTPLGAMSVIIGYGDLHLFWPG